jgi:hypothetical protein
MAGRPILMMPSSVPPDDPSTRRLPIWTVYRPTTSDYAGRWFARVTDVYNKPSRRLRRGTFHVAESLEALRAKLPCGLHRLPRDSNDDPVIEEVWI